MKFIYLSLLVLFASLAINSQSLDDQLAGFQKQLDALETQKLSILGQVETLKLSKIQEDISQVGIPELKEGEEVVWHSAYGLVYSEQHEQAKWVSHIIIRDIIDGKAGRSNDFREDTLVKTGSAIEKDYFLKTPKKGGKGGYDYDGFGYDRGHLAPSADFRWSKKALSESYFYSNMSPQLGDFNRKKWANLEGLLRGYIFEHPETQLYVVTGPLLKDDLPVIERSVNKVSIPEEYFKIALDLQNKKAIAFIMPNENVEYPIISYAVPIDEVEERTGINFFHQIEDSLENDLESQKNTEDWVPEKQKGDVPPVSPTELPRGVFNSVIAKNYMGKGEKISVLGTIVGGRKTRKGHLFFNIDKGYPNQIFTVAVWKQNIVNFSYDPLVEWEGKQVTIKGKIDDFDGIPTMILEKENAIQIME